jgi:hypothetical protein
MLVLDSRVRSGGTGDDSSKKGAEVKSVFGLIGMLRLCARHCAEALKFRSPALRQFRNRAYRAFRTRTYAEFAVAMNCEECATVGTGDSFGHFGNASEHQGLRALMARIAEIFNGGLPLIPIEALT